MHFISLVKWLLTYLLSSVYNKPVPNAWLIMLNLIMLKYLSLKSNGFWCCHQIIKVNFNEINIGTRYLVISKHLVNTSKAFKIIDKQQT